MKPARVRERDPLRNPRAGDRFVLQFDSLQNWHARGAEVRVEKIERDRYRKIYRVTYRAPHWNGAPFTHRVSIAVFRDVLRKGKAVLWRELEIA